MLLKEKEPFKYKGKLVLLSEVVMRRTYRNVWAIQIYDDTARYYLANLIDKGKSLKLWKKIIKNSIKKIDERVEDENIRRKTGTI